ncbi:MAG: membrane integrity-associated transporter subunit PqiC [Proteobacteria bacterium]|nr:membrane integrity-associated transporter subunit PqiC [Pseudomonadota bacterium]
MISLRCVVPLAPLLWLAACSSPAIPEVTYFRLPAPAAVARMATPLSSLPIEVDTFRADGVYAEQAVLYATTPDAGALRAYHYQMWSDPPARGLQERLTDRLRDAGVAPLVTDRLPSSVQALRIQGRILHYERVQNAAKVSALVEFEMRIEQDSGEPLLERRYRAEAVATGPDMAAMARAFGTAVDTTFSTFVADLVAMQEGKS